MAHALETNLGTASVTTRNLHGIGRVTRLATSGRVLVVPASLTRVECYEVNADGLEIFSGYLNGSSHAHFHCIYSAWRTEVYFAAE